MAENLNKVQLIGRLGKDPEARTTQSGKTIVNFSLATGRSWKDKNTGEKREQVEWHTVVVFNEPLARIVEQYCRKGSRIYVEGALRTRKWQDQQGADRWTTEVVLEDFRGAIELLDQAPSNRPPPADSSDDYGKAKSGAATQAPATSQGLDDDIPF